MGDSSIQPELYESGPSKFEWALAFIVLIVPFMSFCYSDTKCIIAYEIKFAQAILNCDLRLAYDMQVFKDLNLAFPWWDLPLNLTLGIWGIPLYLWSCKSGELVINFHESFLQILYGKSILLAAFIFSAVLVYKICRAININPQKSRWGAYIYFTSAMSINVISIIGQSDIICVCLTLLGVLAYIRNEDKKFLFWLILACQFKQFAFFLFVPLLLLREKNLLRLMGKIFLLLVVMIICNAPFILLPEVAKARAAITRNVLGGLLGNGVKLLWDKVPILLLMWGALCIYCWLHDFDKNLSRDEINYRIIFIAMLSMIILFASFTTSPYWFMHMIPYFSIMAVCKDVDSRKFLLFESLTMASIIFYYCCLTYWCYTPNNAINMLLYKMTGSPDLINIKALMGNNSDLVISNKLINFIVKVVKTQLPRTLSISVYIICIWTCAYIASPRKLSNYTQGGGGTFCDLMLCSDYYLMR